MMHLLTLYIKITIAISAYYIILLYPDAVVLKTTFLESWDFTPFLLDLKVRTQFTSSHLYPDSLSPGLEEYISCSFCLSVLLQLHLYLETSW